MVDTDFAMGAAGFEPATLSRVKRDDDAGAMGRRTTRRDTARAMSQTDIEMLRSEYQAMSRKDWADLFRAAHPRFELKTPDGNLALSGVFRGAERARRVFEDFFEPFDAVTVEPEAFFEGNGQIVVFFLQRSKPKGSNAVVKARAAHIWTIRDGKATRLEIFPQREKALKAAGLSE